MRTITKTFNVYKFSELSRIAKDRAKNDYLHSDSRDEDFAYILDDYFGGMFPNSDLNQEVSLAGRQGDGFNTYGRLNLKDMDQIRTKAIQGELADEDDMFSPLLQYLTGELPRLTEVGAS